MDDRFLYIYLLAMREELFAATNANRQIAEAASRVREAEDWDRTERVDVFDEVNAQDDMRAGIECLLSAHARMSFYLFPSAKAGARGKTRARELRRRLDVPDDHPLSYREPRNTWVHLDEAIDSRVWEGNGDQLILEHFGDARLANLDDSDRRIVRLIDPRTQAILLLGRRYDVREIYAQVSSVSHRLDKVIDELEEKFEREYPDLSQPPASIDEILGR